jgi:hypothetical protein
MLAKARPRIGISRKDAKVQRRECHSLLCVFASLPTLPTLRLCVITMIRYYLLWQSIYNSPDGILDQRATKVDQKSPLFPPAFLRLAQLLLAFDCGVVSGTAGIADLDCLVKLLRGLTRVIQESMHPAHRFVSTAD